MGLRTIAEKIVDDLSNLEHKTSVVDKIQHSYRGLQIEVVIKHLYRSCSCSAVKRIGVGKFCPDCGGRNSRR